MVTSVQAFKSRDGKIFTTRSECIAHETQVEFFDDYWEDKLYGNQAGSYVEPQDLLDYVDKH